MLLRNAARHATNHIFVLVSLSTQARMPAVQQYRQWATRVERSPENLARKLPEKTSRVRIIEMLMGEIPLEQGWGPRRSSHGCTKRIQRHSDGHASERGAAVRHQLQGFDEQPASLSGQDARARRPCASGSRLPLWCPQTGRRTLPTQRCRMKCSRLCLVGSVTRMPRLCRASKGMKRRSRRWRDETWKRKEQ